MTPLAGRAPLATRASLLLSCALSASCATSPDHFHLLQALPDPPARAQTQFTRYVTISVTIPSLVDRHEMVIETAHGVRILEHERWAAPLVDQIAGTLKQDIEARRADVLVASRRIDPPGAPIIVIDMDLVAVHVRQAEVSIDAQWRVTNAGRAVLGTGRFAAPLPDAGFDSIAIALSTCIAALSERLTQELPAGP